MSYALGNRTLRKLCEEQDPLLWQKAKLTEALFKPYEKDVFTWVATHLKKHHSLPQVETLVAQFPDLQQIGTTPEPSSYYVELLTNQFCHDKINKANLESQQILKDNKDNHEGALKVLMKCAREITEQKYRHRIVDVGVEAAEMVLKAYHKTMAQDEQVAIFGWPYMDQQFGGALVGDVISFVGRPAAGKTWKMLWSAMKNWQEKQHNVLFVSMEMQVLPITQRITSVYTHQPIQQLKTSSFSTATFQKFYKSLQTIGKEKAKFYVIDGNLAASVDDVFILADMLECRVVFFDGAYLLRHPNTRLDRFTRAAENVEAIKRYANDMNMISFCSWQFNRTASQKQKKGGADSGDVEDIGYTDAIGQISTIVLGLYQEDSIETLKSRKVRVIKGRNGEIGQFSIEWAFDVMSFQQSDPPIDTQHKTDELQWL